MEPQTPLKHGSTRGLFSPSALRSLYFVGPFLAAILVVNAFFLQPLYLLFVGILCALALGAVFFAGSAPMPMQSGATRRAGGELEDIIRGFSDALVVYNQNFQVQVFNPAAERLLGLPAGSVVGRTFSPQDVSDPSLRLLVQVLFPSLAPVVVVRSESGVYPVVADISFENPELELRVLTTPLGESPSARGFMKMVRDRTREVALAKSKSEFITVASHQLKSPVTNIVWALDALKTEAALSDDAKNLVRNAHDAGQLLVDIVEGLLMVSKIEDGRFGYSFRSVDLVTFTTHILGEVMSQAERVGVRVYFEKPRGELPAVTADPEKLGLVFQNLLENAIRYNVKGGEVVVSIKPTSEGMLEVMVRDTGIGIPPEDQKKIFTKFYRGANALKYETEGSGLGLYITHNIVRAHGGTIWFESEANRGTTFHFTLTTDPNKVSQKEVSLEY